MGCQASVDIGDNLTFSIVTYDPSTGILTDADSAPAYRIYEDETATPILTGTLAKLDDANTTGFYTELIACTEANGFEDGRSYNIYIVAVVGSDAIGFTYGFRAQNPIWSEATRTLTQSAASVAAAVAGTSISDYRGDTWSISLSGLGDLTGYTAIDFSIKERDDNSDDNAILRIRLNDPSVNDGLLRLNGADPSDAAAGSITIDDLSDGDITIALDADKSADLCPKDYDYDIQRIVGTVVQTLAKGTFTVAADITRAVS